MSASCREKADAISRSAALGWIVGTCLPCALGRSESSAHPRCSSQVSYSLLGERPLDTRCTSEGQEKGHVYWSRRCGGGDGSWVGGHLRDAAALHSWRRKVCRGDSSETPWKAGTQRSLDVRLQIGSGLLSVHQPMLLISDPGQPVGGPETRRVPRP